METLVTLGSGEYFGCLALLLLGRAVDFLSTWVATPHLVLEGNPVAKRLGWKWGAVLNLGVCVVFGMWPLAAIVITTTSLLVAARNFQSAWLMRLLGEESYRSWYVDRLQEVPLPLYLVCLAGQVLLPAVVGAGLMAPWLWKTHRWLLAADGADDLLWPFAIGLGIVSYALAVALYTLLALWRIRRVRR